MLLTAAIRPRKASGVRVSSRVLRMTTLMLSRPPSIASMSSESQNERDTPKMMVATPKPATDQSRVRPAFLNGGACAITMEMATAPTEGAARSHPRRSEEHTELQSRQYL